MKRLTLNNISSKLIAKVREKIDCFRTFDCTHVAEKNMVAKKIIFLLQNANQIGNGG